MRADEFSAVSTPNATSFGFDKISPPSSLYVQRDDVLVLYATSSVAGEQITFRARFLRVPEVQGGQPSDAAPGKRTGTIITAGIVETIEHVFAPAVAGLFQTATKVLGEGYLLSVSAISQTVNDRGRTFAGAQLDRSTPGNPVVSQQLFCDYCTHLTACGWPGGRIVQSSEGTGWKHSQVVTNPGAGADWTFGLAATQRMRIESLAALLTTSAAVANRNVELIVDDGANTVWAGQIASSIVASSTVTVVGAGGNTQAGPFASLLQIPLPTPLILERSWRIRAVTANIQAADQWSSIFLNVEEWLAAL